MRSTLGTSWSTLHANARQDARSLPPDEPYRHGRLSAIECDTRGQHVWSGMTEPKPLGNMPALGCPSSRQLHTRGSKRASREPSMTGYSRYGRPRQRICQKRQRMPQPTPPGSTPATPSSSGLPKMPTTCTHQAHIVGVWGQPMDDPAPGTEYWRTTDSSSSTPIPGFSSTWTMPFSSTSMPSPPKR